MEYRNTSEETRVCDLVRANGMRTGEAAIRKLVEDSVRALHDRDIDRLVSSYAPDVMLFDVVNPLRHSGADAVRKRLEEWLSTFEGPIGYEVRDLSITTADDVGFSHNLNHVSATTKDGKTFDMWWRATVGYRNLNGKWLITHEHASVPFDVGSGKASLDLKPS
jgi:uncharacterized protein (TIGR02246 family)